MDGSEIFDVSDLKETVFGAMDVWLETGAAQDETLAGVFQEAKKRSVWDCHAEMDGDAIARKVQAEMRLHFLRGDFVSRYGFIVPTQALVHGAAKLGPLIEVAGGTGYLSRLIAQAGGDILTTDICLQGTTNGYRQVIGSCHPVEQMDAGAAVAAYPRRTVVLAYPDDDPWCETVLESMKPGQRLLYLGERGGCCGTDRFAERLYNEFVVETNLPLFRFPGLHEVAQVLRKPSPVSA